jgi:hypothetical protein
MTDEHVPGGGRLAGVPRSWLAGAAVAALGLFAAGAGIGAVANSGADEQARLQAQLDRTQQDLTDTDRSLEQTRAQRDHLSREQAGVRRQERELEIRQGQLNLRQQELDQRQQELDVRSAGLDQREASIGQAEQAAAETARRNQIPGDGTFLVGEEIRPGRYRSPGGDGRPCYVARLNSLAGGVGDIIDNELSEGPVVIDVRSSDDAVRTNGCQPFQRLG